MPDSIPHPDYAGDGVPRSERKFVGRHNITILDKEQQEGMRKVCRLAREVLDAAAREIRPGVTTDYIDEVVHKACIEREVRKIGRYRGQGLAPANQCSRTLRRSITSTSPSLCARR